MILINGRLPKATILDYYIYEHALQVSLLIIVRVIASENV